MHSMENNKLWAYTIVTPMQWIYHRFEFSDQNITLVVYLLLIMIILAVADNYYCG